MPSNQDRLKSVAEADATAEFMESIGWTEVVLPKLLKQKGLYTDLLVQAVLSNTPPTMDGHETTREQLAGRVYGIDFTIRLLESILRNGGAALEKLEAQGLQIGSKLH